MLQKYLGQSLYEDDGDSFDYRLGAYARRRFAANGDTIDIGAPEGMYRPKARALELIIRSRADAAKVSLHEDEDTGYVRGGKRIRSVAPAA